MLVGAYPFEDPEDPKNFRKTIGVSRLYFFSMFELTTSVLKFGTVVSFICVQRIMSAQHSIPDYVRISADCRNLLSRIFVANPSKVTFVS